MENIEYLKVLSLMKNIENLKFVKSVYLTVFQNITISF